MTGRKQERQSARDRAAAERAAELERRRRHQRLLRIGAPVIAIVLVVAVGIVLQGRSTRAAVDVTAARPHGISTVGGGFAIGKPGAPVIDLYEDFQCPICKSFESVSGPTLTELADQGKARVVFHPLSFLDANNSNDSSSRAASAFGCAIDAGVGADFHGVVFGNQPEKEGVGYTDATLQQFGKNSGIPAAALPAFNSCVTKHTYLGWARQVQAGMEKAGVTGTPTMFINGKRYDYATRGKVNHVYTPDGLKAAVAAIAPGAADGTPAAQASAEPSAG